MAKHWLTCPGIGLDKSGVKPVAKDAVKRDSNHACPTAGLEVGKYMGWGASVASEPTQVALAWMTAIAGTDHFPFLWPGQITGSRTKTKYCGLQSRSGSAWVQRKNEHEHVSEQCKCLPWHLQLLKTAVQVFVLIGKYR